MQCLSLVLCSLALSMVCGQLSGLPYTSERLDGYSATRSEWSKLLRENLAQDLEPWQERAPLKTADVIAAHTYFMEEVKMNPSTLKLVLIYNNTLFFLPPRLQGQPMTEPPNPSPYKRFFHQYMSKALASGRITLPNVLFNYNSDDNQMRLGDPRRPVLAPVMSFVKTQGLAGGDDLDILVPQMLYVPRELYYSPWETKRDLAFFRGKYTCTHLWDEQYGSREACSRLLLAYLSLRDGQAGNATALDVGLTQTAPDGVVERVQYRGEGQRRTVDIPIHSKISIGRHAPYKWLWNLEGMVAAYRLTQLMTINSLILHQRTPYIEYFYRSIHPMTHYVPFWNTTGKDGKLIAAKADVYGVIEQVRRLERQNSSRIQEIISNAQMFAAKHLTVALRLRYYKAALAGYKVGARHCGVPALSFCVAQLPPSFSLFPRYCGHRHTWPACPGCPIHVSGFHPVTCVPPPPRTPCLQELFPDMDDNILKYVQMVRSQGFAM